MNKESADELLREGLGQLGLSFDEARIKQFLLYLTELKKWNRAYNLTAIKTDEDIVIKHFLDSLLFLKVLPVHIRSVADIGSGAGFPGLPLKIMRPDLEMFLVEPVQKKILFLEHIQRTLNIQGLKFFRMRIEDVRDIEVDAVVTRALFSIADLTAKAGKILGDGGVFILSKGPKVEDELRGQESFFIKQEDLILPFHNSTRHLVVVQKERQQKQRPL